MGWRVGGLNGEAPATLSNAARVISTDALGAPGWGAMLQGEFVQDDWDKEGDEGGINWKEPRAFVCALEEWGPKCARRWASSERTPPYSPGRSPH